MKAVTCTNTKLEVVDQPTLRPAKGQLLIEVLDHGPGTRKTPPVGTPVVAVPLVKPGKDVHAIGLSAVAPGAYAEQLHNLRLPWWHLWRVADKVGAATPKHPVDLRMCWRAWHYRRHHQQRAAVLTCGRCRRLHGRGPVSAIDGDQARSSQARSA